MRINYTLGDGVVESISLRDKIGQMLIIGFEGDSAEGSLIAKSIEQDNVGGVILFDYNYKTKQFDKNIHSPAQVEQLNHRLQEINSESNIKHNRPRLPLFISVDYEGGAVDRLHSRYGFPKTNTPAEIGQMNVDDAQEVALKMALILKKCGFNVNFAPMVDVNTNQDNPIVAKLGRSFSSHPSEVSKYASIFTEQFLANDILPVYKHFPGHGSSDSDSHLGFVDVTSTWQDCELQPYQYLLCKHKFDGMVMTAHIVNRKLDASGLPATLSYDILTRILRERLKFNGVIIADDMQMKAISEYYSLEKALVLAINAGVDMFIFGNQLSDEPQQARQIVDIIENKVLTGEISHARIDDAYKHIVEAKQYVIA